MTLQHGPLYCAWRRFAANRAAVVSGLMLLTLIVMAMLTPVIAKANYTNTCS